MCVPLKLTPYFQQLDVKKGENTIVRGKITCCSCSEFEILYYGDKIKSFFGHITLCEKNDGLILMLCCKKCGQQIDVFNSFTDGYDCCAEGSKDCGNIRLEPFSCTTSEHTDFSVEVSFEYPPKEELIELGIRELENSFTWIWITLKCNRCNKVFKKIVDFETA